MARKSAVGPRKSERNAGRRTESAKAKSSARPDLITREPSGNLYAEDWRILAIRGQVKRKEVQTITLPIAGAVNSTQEFAAVTLTILGTQSLVHRYRNPHTDKLIKKFKVDEPKVIPCWMELKTGVLFERDTGKCLTSEKVYINAE